MLYFGVHFYFHIPFCVQICSYCDFCKTDSSDGGLIDDYLDALENEMVVQCEKGTRPVTVYMGGGTPSRLGIAQLKKLMRIIDQVLDLSALKEFTFEADPCTLTSDKVKLLKDVGVTRVSMGAQSLNDDILSQMNRIHRSDDIYEMTDLLHRHNFSNINCDVIVGWPGQTKADLSSFVDFLRESSMAHSSCYILGVEQGTALYRDVQDGITILPPDAMASDLYNHFRKEVESIGLMQYELSNFARAGYQSLHNKAYWSHNTYIGIGAGASSFDGAVRGTNNRNISGYIMDPFSGRESDHLGENDIRNERVMLQLRQSDGLDEADINVQHLPVLTELMKKGLILKTETGYRIAPEHFPVSNSIISELFS